jgi:hypothetical protein
MLSPSPNSRPNAGDEPDSLSRIVDEILAKIHFFLARLLTNAKKWGSFVLAHSHWKPSFFISFARAQGAPANKAGGSMLRVRLTAISPQTNGRCLKVGQPAR